MRSLPNDLLPPALDWGMSAFGGTIEPADLASPDPVEWHYADVEVFYMTGRCHYLAMAYHREMGHRIGVLVETDPDELAEPDLVVPLHVYGIDRATGDVLDVRGRRSVEEMIEDFAGTVGLMHPKRLAFDTDDEFVRAFVDRRDRPLRAFDELDIEKATALVAARGPMLRAEYERNEAATADASFVPPVPGR